jgi:Bacterial membrane protein YfhO
MPRIVVKSLPVFVLLGLILLFFCNHIFSTDGEFIGGRDVLDYFFFHALFIKEQFLSGSVPLWNPYYYSGQPFLANPVNSVFYPGTLFFIFLPLPLAFTVDTLFHLCLGAVGMYFFVHLITKSTYAGISSAIVYCLSGYFMSRIYAGHVTMYHTPAFVPWIFLFIEKFFLYRKVQFLLISGLLLGLQILAGYPQGSFYSAVFLTVYFVFRYFSIPNGLSKKQLGSLGIYYFAIPLVAFGISAVQILPSMEFMSLSTRANNSYEFATFMSFPPQNFFTFLVPAPPVGTDVLDTNWEFGGYVGVLAIILGGIGLVFSKPKRYTWCFGIFLFLSITGMLGSYTPLYKLYLNLVPMMSTFRIPARCLIYFTFSTAVLVGFGVKSVCESTLSKRQHLVVLAALLIVLITILLGGSVFKIPFRSKEILLAVGLIISSIILLNTARFKRTKKLIGPLIISILFIDLFLIYAPKIPIANQDTLRKIHGFEHVLAKETELCRINLPHPTGTALSLRGMKFNYHVANGYTTIVLNDYYRFVHHMAGLPEPELRRHTFNSELFEGNWLTPLESPGITTTNPVFSSKILNIKYGLVKNANKYDLRQAKTVMPRALLVRDAVFLPQLEDHLTRIKKDSFDPQKQVLIQAESRDHVQDSTSPNPATTANDVVSIDQYSPNEITLKSSSPGSTYLVLSELYYPGWHAYVDGKEVPILRADFILRAISLSPGVHDIVFSYMPVSFIAGASISGFTLLLLAAFFVVSRRRKRA